MARAILIRTLMLTLAFLLVDAFMDDVTVDGGFLGAIGLAVVYGIVSGFLGSIVRRFTLPVRELTHGLFDLAINAGMLLVTSWLTDWLTIDGAGSAVVAAVILGLASAVIGYFVTLLVYDVDR